jgi:glucokinase
MSRPPAIHLLAGDIGGTNVRLRVVEASDLRTPVVEQVFRKTPILEALSAFIHEIDVPVASAGIGCAGRVVDGDVRMTNRPGEVVTNERVARALELPADHVVVVNDMVAHISGVDASETIDLRPGNGEGEVEGIVMAGTGLGTGMRIRVGRRWDPIPSEGGHLDFGPPSPELGRVRDVWLKLRGGTRVTWENVASGPGLPILYAAAVDPERPEAVELPSPECVTSVITGGNTGGIDPIAARQAVAWHLELVGARAGNLCLGSLATRGITFAGGLLNALWDADAMFVREHLLPAFDACGPEVLRSTLHETPLRLLRSSDSGLIGAGALARAVLRPGRS